MGGMKYFIFLNKVGQRVQRQGDIPNQTVHAGGRKQQEKR